MEDAKPIYYILARGAKRRPLSYFFPNSNGALKDFIGFSFRNFATFPTREEAECHKYVMLRVTQTREAEVNLKTWLRLFSVVEGLRVCGVFA
jgi:hypothetical protein